MTEHIERSPEPRRQADNAMLDHLMDVGQRLGRIEVHIEQQGNRDKKLQDHVDMEESEFRAIRSEIKSLHNRLQQIPDEIHRKHHELIDAQIKKEEDRHELVKDLKSKLGASGIWGAVLVLGAVIWFAAKHYIEDITNRGP